MRSSLLSFAAAIAVACCVSAAQAAGTLAYSFETGNDGFGPNGGGTYTQDTIGATEGTGSLKVAIPAGPTFVGGLTGNLAPSIGDPPGVSHILFDMTIVDPYAGSGFAVVGVTVWGCTQGGVSCGNPFQFADFEHIGGKAAGTYTDIRIDLDSAVHAHPITFETGMSFNEIFGPNPGDPLDIIPTHFQLFFNQTGDAPVTVYIDNIRTVVPEPATCSLFGLGALAVGMVVRRRR